MSMLSVNLNSNPNPIEAAQIITATNIMFLRIVSITVHKIEKAFFKTYMKEIYRPSLLMSNLLLNISQHVYYFSESWSLNRVFTLALLNQPRKIRILRR